MNIELQDPFKNMWHLAATLIILCVLTSTGIARAAQTKPEAKSLSGNGAPYGSAEKESNTGTSGSQSPKTTVTIALNRNHGFEYAGYYAAKKKGYFSKAGLDIKWLLPKLTMKDKGPAGEVLNGSADFGLMGSALVLERLSGKPLVLLANDIKHSQTGIVTRAGIDAPGKLRGAKVMGTYEDRKSAEIAWFLSEAGLSASQVTWVPQTGKLSDLKKGRFDAMTVPMAMLNPKKHLNKSGLTPMNPVLKGADLCGNNLFTSEKFLEQNPLLVEEFTDASRDGWIYAMENMEEIASWMIQNIPGMPDLEEILEDADSIKKLMRPSIYKQGSVDPARVRRIADLYMELGMAEAGYNLQGFILNGPHIKSQKAPLNLTPEQKEWVLKNPEVSVAVLSSFEPFSYVRHGKHKGFSSDFFRVLSKKTGLRFKPVYGEWADNLERFRNKEVDLIDSISYQKERESFTLFTRPYFKAPMALFTRNDFGSYTGIRQLFGKRLGVEQGTWLIPTLNRFPSLDLEEVVGSDALLQGLSVGRFDAVIINRGHAITRIRQLDLYNIRSAGELNIEGIRHEDLRIGVQPHRPILHAIISKALNALNDDDLATIHDKWFMSMSGEINRKIQLSEDEKQFLKTHPVVRVGNESNWPPFDFNVAGEPKGFTIDLLNLISARTGVEFLFESGYSWTETMNRFKNRDIDLVHSLTRNEERESYGLFSTPFYHSRHKLVTRTGSPVINDISDLYGKTLGMPSGWAVSQYLKKHHPRIKQVNIESTMEAMNSISQGKIFGTIEQEAITLYFMKRHGFTDLKLSFWLKEFDALGTSAMHIAVRKDWPVLMDLIEKAMATITPGEIAKLETKWFGQVRTSGHEQGKELKLTETEKEFLKKKKRITYAVNKDFMPFEGMDEGEISGMITDLMTLFENKLQVPFDAVISSSANEATQMVMEGRCDIRPMESKSPMQEDTLLLTPPYLTSSVAIIARENFPFIAGLNDLTGKDVGILKDSGLREILQREHPLISFEDAGSVQEGLLRVSSGAVSAFVIDLPVASYNIRALGLTNLKVAGHLPELRHLGVGIRKDIPQLHKILEKTVASLTRDEIDAINQKWISMRYEHKFNTAILWKVLGAATVIILAIALWNRKLTSLNRSIAEANAKLAQLSATDRLTGLNNRMKLDDMLCREVERTQRYGTNLSIILMDVDFFKAVNDNYGHLTGDAVLKTVSEIMKLNIRKTDTCGRWGGEEFMVICPDTNLSGAKTLGEHLRKKISSQNFPKVGTITGSFGITQYIEGDSEELLTAKADKALYRAKLNGRNRVETEA